MILSSTARIVVPEGVLFRELDGEAILLNLNSESYFGLDDVGTRMWTVLTTSASIRAALDLLLADYAVEPDVLSRDLDDFVEKLVAQGLLEIADA